ncbi:hypothetical protein niasHT_037096 [Heterodera trifolii]|uniref:GBF1-like tetratricopeptide repeats domain-containing protein n=1 Tax=Heterodera trifolii TaxID=157864 RepID=A0ABD2J5R7_9BILA
MTQTSEECHLNSPPSSQPLHSRPAFNGTNSAEISYTARHWKQWNSPEQMALAFGENKKAQMAARAMFDLVHQYGDNLREGWMNVLDCLLYMLKANLLPSPLVQLEDFVELSGFVSLKHCFKRRPTAPKKEESGLLSWLGLTGSSATGGGESGQSRPQSEQEKELSKLAANIMAECHPEQIVLDSRYLASSSLTELVNSIIHCSFTVAPILCTLHGPTHQQHDKQQQHSQHESQDEDSFVDLSNVAVPPAEMLRRAPTDGTEQQPLLRQTAGSTLSIESTSDDRTSLHNSNNGFQQNGPSVVKLSPEEEEAMVFLLELVTNIVLENRDRLAQVWSPVRDHLRTLLSHFPHNQQLMERAVVSIVRIANRNLFRLGQHFTPTPMLHFMACELLSLRPPELFLFSRQIASGLNQLLRANAANMQPADWEDCFAEVLFPLLSKLLASSPPISPMDPIGMEEARIRAIQFICKILLGNLTQISRLDSFADLLSHLFELMDQFLEGSSCSDLLAEVIQESLKNCVLVCENFGVFRDNLAEFHSQLQERLNALAKKHEIASSVGTIKLST